MAAKKKTGVSSKTAKSSSGKRVAPKNVTLEQSDIDALERLATHAQTSHIMQTGKQNPGIGHSWVIRSLIRNAGAAFEDYVLGQDHPAPGAYFGISGDISGDIDAE